MHGMCPDLEAYGKGWNRGFTNKDFFWIVLLGGMMTVMILWSIFLAGIHPFIAIMMGTFVLFPVSMIAFTKVETMSFGECLGRYIALSDNTYYFVPEIPVSEEVKQKRIKGGKKRHVGKNTGKNAYAYTGEKNNTGHSYEKMDAKNDNRSETTTENSAANDSNLKNI